MYKYNKRPNRMIPVLMTTAAVLLALAPMSSYAVSKWTSHSWGTPNLNNADQAMPALGNFNADPAHPNTLDLAMGDRFGVVHFYYNVGTASAPSWTAEQTALRVDTSTTSGSYAVPDLADLNGDGLLDLIVGGRNTVRIYQNVGTATTPSWTEKPTWEITGLASNRFYSPAVADLNGDGKPDLMLGWTNGSVIAYRNSGTSTTPAWTRQTTWDTIPVTGTSAPALADLNGDGLPDLLIGGNYGSIYAFYNTGTTAAPVWTTIGDWFVSDPNPNIVNYAGPAIGDLNGDGLPDLLVGDISGVLYGYRNDGLPKYPTSGTGPPPPPATTTVTDTFENFSCGGSWKLAAGGPNTSYTRKCSDGWTAFAQDVAAPSSSTQLPGPIGNQNVVTLDNTVNGPNTPTGTLGAAELYTNPTSAIGVLWLLKTYPVIPGVAISSIQADFRNMSSTATSQVVGMVVFNGTVTNPSGQTNGSGVPLRSDVLDADMRFQNCGAGVWCPWTTSNLGATTTIIPNTSTITVAFRLEDVYSNRVHYGELDNVKVSGVSTSTQLPIPTGDIAQLWNNAYAAPGSNNDKAEAVDVTTDAAGNVYVTGKSYQSGVGYGNYDIVTLKYDAAGNQVWQRTYDNPSHTNADDVPVKIAVDGSGNIYVAGNTYVGSNNPIDPTFNNHDFVVVKYDSAGSQVWASTFDNTNSADSDDEPTDMAVDSAGNVIVTGSSCSGSGGVACAYLTVEFNSSGGTAWSDVYGGTNIGDYDQAVGVSLDGSGNAYVTGRTSGASDDITTIKYDTAGNQAWVTTFAGRTNDRPIGIRTDSAGNSYVVGWNFDTSTPDIIALRYDTNGNQLWYKTYDSGGEDIPVAMTMDASGNLYIVGTTGRVGDHNFVTIKYLPDGTNAWLRTFGNSGVDDIPVDIAVDGNGEVYVLGTVAVSQGNTNFVTVKYSDTGVPLSAITFDKYGIADTAVAMVLNVDGQGDTTPIVVGYSKNNQTQLDEITTVKYEQAYPDLTISSFSGPSTGIANTTISLSNSVLNIDDLANKKHADSGAFTVGFFLAPDIGGVPDLGAMTQFASRSISNLSPGDTNSDTTSVLIPASTIEGDYFLVAVADPDSVVTERDETNNRAVSATPITIQGVYPDLAVTGFSGPASAARGDTISVTATITNLVSITAASFRVGIYLSSDTNITTGDILIANYTVTGGLTGFASDSRTINVPIPGPGSLAAGNYYLGIIADDQSAVTEADEANNTEILRTGTSTSTRLLTDTDFIPGLTGSSDVVVVGSGNAGHVSLSQSVGWTLQSSWNPPSVRSAATPAMADMNGDGKMDIMIGSSTGANVLYYNTGTSTVPSWTAAPSTANVSISDTYSVPAFGNLDPGTDSNRDLLIGGRGGVYAYRNTGTASAPLWTRQSSWDITGLPSNRFYAPTIKDINGDGLPDVLLGNTVGTVVAYKNIGSSTNPVWSAQASWNGPSVASGSAQPALVDVDGDGLVDLMIGDNAGTVFGYRNTGSASGPTWTATPSWNLADPNTSLNNGAAPAFGDLDGDGAVDMIYGDASGFLFAYKNSGSYITTGTYISPVKDAGTHGGFTILHYVPTLPTGTSISVDIRAGNTSTPDGSWTPWLTSIPDDGDISSLNTPNILRYVQYRVNLATSVPSATPALYSIEAKKLDAPPQPTVLSVLTASGGSGSGGGGLGVLDLTMLGLAGMMVRLLGRRRARRH